MVDVGLFVVGSLVLLLLPPCGFGVDSGNEIIGPLLVLLLFGAIVVVVIGVFVGTFGVIPICGVRVGDNAFVGSLVCDLLLVGDDEDFTGLLLVGDEEDASGFLIVGDEDDCTGLLLVGDDEDARGLLIVGDEEDFTGFLLVGDDEDVKGLALVGDEEYVNGFWVLNVPSLEAAMDWGRQAAKACRASVEVRPFY